MGMYSYFEYEEIQVTDWEGLVKFLEEYKKSFPNYWIWEHIGINNLLDKKNKTFTFNGWNDIKLISYWYDHDVRFLKLLAYFIEGRVEWDFENKDEAGYIDFTNQECMINTGVTYWNRSKPESFMNTKPPEEYDYFVKKIIIPNKL